MKEIGGQLLTEDQLRDARSQQAAVEGLLERLDALRPLVDTMRTLELSMRDAAAAADEEVAAVARDAELVREELANVARELNVSEPSADQPLYEAWHSLATVVEERLGTVG